MSIPNCDEISINGWVIFTSGCESERPPYWNSISGFDRDLFIVISIAFSIGVPNFIQFGRRSAEL